MLSEQRQNIKDVYGQVEEFLPEAYDDAILGVVRRIRDKQRVAYDFTTCVKIAEKQVGEKALTRVSSILRCPGVVFVMPIDRPRFWEDVIAHRIPLWENLTPAICGVAAGCSADRAAVYDRELAIDCLMNSYSLPGSEADEDNLFNLARRFFVKKIYGTWLGPNRPYYLLRVH